MKILVINGPNINMLGIREKNIYGKDSYDDLKNTVFSHAKELNIECCEYQSNHEGDIVDKIQASLGIYDGIVINPAAYTHTSIAIADALKAVNIPCAEVHISDVTKREAYRQVSYVRDICIFTVMGKGIDGYKIAISKLKEYIENKEVGKQ